MAASGKSRDVPNAANDNKKVETTKNRMGQPEQTVTKDGEKEHVLNEIDPEDGEEEIMDDFDITARRHLGGRRCKYQASGLSQPGDENLPDSHNESRGYSMRRQIDETVQDQSGVNGDFMEKMGGKTDRLGAKQKNTGGAYEKHSESTSGSPDDGIQTELGKGDLLGAKQKNTGGTFETLKNSASSKASDGIQDSHSDMAGDLGQNEKQKNKGGQHEPLKGSKNKMSEAWSIDNVSSIMEEDDVDIQQLFDAYAREANPVTLEEFEQLAMAHGCAAAIDESVLKALMSANNEFIFYESEDAHGPFWMAGPITEGEKPFPGAAPPFGSKGEDDDDGDDDETEEECAECTEGKEPGKALGEGFRGRRFGGAEEAAYDPFQSELDLDRMMLDPGAAEEYPEIEPEVGPQMDLDFGDEPDDDLDDYYEDDLGMGEEPMGGLGGMEEEPMGGMGGMGGLGGMEEEPRGGMGMRRRPFEGRDRRGETINEMTGTSGIAAPPMGTGISRGAAVKRSKAEDPLGDLGSRQDDDDVQDIKIVENFQQCPKCGGILDTRGCPTCALMRETHELGVDAPDPSTDANGRFTSDSTTSGLGPVSGGIKGALTQESGSTKADDGITTELGGMGSQLGQNEKQKNKGGQHEPLKGGGSSMQENVRKLNKVAIKAIREGALSLRQNGKFKVDLIVHCEGIKPKALRSLTEALVDVEELMQAYGHDAVKLEARYFGNGKVFAKREIRLPAVKARGPVVAENRCIFRHAEVANDFADGVVSEGAKCKLDRHNWGVSVGGRFDYSTAQRAFANISAINESRERSFE